MKLFDVKHITKHIRNEQVTIDWLDGLGDSSKRNYIIVLSEFVLVNNLTPTELLTKAHQDQEQRLPSWERNITKWFKKYEQHHHEYERSKNTRDMRTTIIKSFFHFHGIDTPKEHKKRRKSHNNYLTPNKRQPLSRSDIKTALDSCKSSRLCAMILIQCSSGIAVTDLINLPLETYKQGLIRVDQSHQIGMFRLRRRKTGKPFTTFISPEAVKAVETYLKTERPQTGHDKLFLKFYRNEPLTEYMVQKDLRTLNQRMGLTHEKYKFRSITSHMFRKYFNTTLTNAGMPYEIRKHLMGHSLESKVDDAYYLENPKELERVYLEYLPHLLIYETETITINTTDEDVKMLKDDLERVKQLLKMRKED